MLQFRNETPFVGSIAMMPDVAGVDTLIAVVKATFTMGRHPSVAESQVPVAVMPEYYGEPASSSMRVAPDVSLPKPSTDVLLTGSAVASLGHPVTDMIVEMHVGPISRFARVFGDRRWQATTSGYAMTAPEPFVTLPLTWERAFGGREETPRGIHEEPRNPVGTGFRAPDGRYTFDGLPLPNVEHPAHLIASWKDRPIPCGFGPVSPHWEPRRSFAGTYDAAWQAERAPYLPDDFDERFLQVAPPDAIASPPLAGGETVILRGFSAQGDISFALPRAELEINFVVDGTVVPRPLSLDTLTLEPDSSRFTMVWRARFAADKRARRVSEVRASLRSLS